MPTVYVRDGNLEEALTAFKRLCKKEGVIAEYKRGLAFTPSHVEKARKVYRREHKQGVSAER